MKQKFKAKKQLNNQVLFYIRSKLLCNVHMYSSVISVNRKISGKNSMFNSIIKIILNL